MRKPKLKRYTFDIVVIGKSKVTIDAYTLTQAIKLIESTWKGQVTSLTPPDIDIIDIELPIELKIKPSKITYNAKITHL